MSKLEALFYVALFALVAVVFGCHFENRKECEKTGGAYVRGLWGFECVKVK